MEEFVGKLWHRFITHAAGGHFPDAAVRLRDVDRMLGVFFRALGGDPGLRIAPATKAEHGARRGWLKRVAAADERAAVARMDELTLRLPPSIDWLPSRDLNRALYLWLAAVAATQETHADAAGAVASHEPLLRDLQRNRHATRAALARWPGLASRYRTLVEASLAVRPRPESLPPAEAARERLIRAALSDPHAESDTALPPLPVRGKPHYPVAMWLAEGERATRTTLASHSDGKHDVSAQQQDREAAHRAEKAETGEDRHGMLLPFRAESLLSVAEFIRVKRSQDDEPDDHANAAAQNLELLTFGRNEERIAARVRFDLDLPSSVEDDVVLGAGLPLPEWDYRKGVMLEDHVRLNELCAARDDPRAAPCPLPEHLRPLARQLHRQLAALQPGRRWLKGQADGSELDLDAIVRTATDRRLRQHVAYERLYLKLEKRDRDLACLMLADLSLSTDAWISDTARVVDIIRDTLMVFGDALSATGDRFALCGFSSLRRANVRFHRFKDFSQPFDAVARGRIHAIKPGYYTRLGAAIRHATNLLAREPAGKQLLLILSDGKPNDLDLYDGRYGIEDTRVAIMEARKRGLTPFCVTIDREGADYLPHLFGPNGFTVIRQPAELPRRLPLVYAQLST